MNTGRLRELVEELLRYETRFELQTKLRALNAGLSNLASSPQEVSYQTEVSRLLVEFEDALKETEESLSPAQRSRLDALGGLPYFTQAGAARIRAALNANSVTPAVVQEETEELVDERDLFLARIRHIQDAFEQLGIDYEPLEPGEAEVGFQIPRRIFNNELGDFAKELSQIKFIVRAFSEVAGNTGEQIEVRQLSTTDPLILLGVAIYTVRSIGRGVAWALNQWKTIEEIRNLRAQTANLQKSAARETVLKAYDKMVNEALDGPAKAEAKRMVKAAKVDSARKQELETHLHKALKMLMARIEHGMVVELRLGPPPENVALAEEGEEAALTNDDLAYQEVARLQQTLVFPSTKGEPLLSLTQTDEPPKNAQAGEPNKAG